MRIAAAAALLALGGLMAGCAGPSGAGMDVNGNEAGGKLSYAEGQMPAAMNAARAHCAKFGKKTQVTRMAPAAQGGEIGFICQ